jgi:hypothetical protein
MTLSMWILKFQGRIGLIGGIFIDLKPLEYCHPWVMVQWVKKMYSKNNMVVLDHCALFIYLDVGYPSSFNDVPILRKLDLYKNQW